MPMRSDMWHQAQDSIMVVATQTEDQPTETTRDQSLRSAEHSQLPLISKEVAGVKNLSGSNTHVLFL